MKLTYWTVGICWNAGLTDCMCLCASWKFDIIDCPPSDLENSHDWDGHSVARHMLEFPVRDAGFAKPCNCIVD